MSLIPNTSKGLIIGSLPALLAFAALAGGEAPSYEDREAGALLLRIADAQRIGNFEGAWHTWEAFLAHPGRNEPYLDDFSTCLLKHGCPEPGPLGAMLGRSRDEARNLTSFCPHWHRLLQSLGNKPESAEQLDLIRSRGLARTCQEWYERQLAKLHERPVIRPEPKMQVVPILFQEPVEGRVFPNVRMSFGDHAPWVLVDTGSTTTTAFGAGSPLGAYLLSMGTRLTSIDVRTTHGLRNADVFRAPALRLGVGTFNQVLVDIMAERIAPEVEHLLGMNMLLRYPAVCFHWTGGRLHLGAAGPCGAGVQLDGVRLIGGFVFAMELPMRDGSTLDVGLDTGAPGTYCSTIFFDRNGGERTFSFGPDERFRATCREPRPLGPGATPLAPLPGQHQANIGMETLLEFEAFGWELNPLRVYLVPKTPDA